MEASVHDNRPMLVKHIDRILDERVRPAVKERLAPVRVEAWEVTDAQGPVAGVAGGGEPVPVSAALSPQAPFRPFTVPGPWGPAWGTT